MPESPIDGYEILSELGHTYGTTVYKARDLRQGRLVAIRAISAGPNSPIPDREAVLAEAKLLGDLRHPNIVTLHAVVEQGDTVFLIQEFMEGGGLYRKLNGTPWSVASAARLVEGLARGAHHAHVRGIFHGAITPSNILLAPGGQGKLTDFGSARRMANPIALEAISVGVPRHMSPEQFRGGPQHVGPATDVWALGTILYELLTGRPAFPGKTAIDIFLPIINEKPFDPGPLHGRVPPGLEAAVLKCLEKEPARRHATAEGLADALHAEV